MQQKELFQHLYKIQNSSSDSIAMLQKDVEQFPFFGINHFLLLKELHQSNKIDSDTAAKTALYFSNGYWLNYLLNKKATAKEEAILDASEPAPLPEKTDEPLFEPLFATDYFASQGIKLSEEVQNSDKLGKQLKSFTEWLKTMKKVNGNRLPETTEAVDKAIEHIAEKSNTTEDIVTETMAEVFIQQGKLAKAIEIYKKLSLHNPSKSVFFADKIKNLKGK
jgi:hypothetical protein